MGLSVIGAGFGRTGTLSIKAALDQLGFGPCYHMKYVFEDPAHLRRWQSVADGRPPDWDELYAGFASTVDWPGTLYWRELADAYPDARILLSVRATDSWWNSFSSTVTQLIGMRDSFSDAHRRAVLDYAHEIIEKQTFGGDLSDKRAVLAAYENRIGEVKKATAPDRLLVYDITNGWEPLCEFLDVPVPATDFPRGNDSVEFWQRFGDGTPPHRA